MSELETCAIEGVQRNGLVDILNWY